MQIEKRARVKGLAARANSGNEIELSAKKCLLKIFQGFTSDITALIMRFLPA